MSVKTRAIVAGFTVLVLCGVGVWSALGQGTGDKGSSSGEQLMNATEILLPEGMTGEEAIGQLAPLVAEYDAKAAAALEAGGGSADAKTEAASFQRAADIYRHALDLVCEKTPDPRCPSQSG